MDKGVKLFDLRNMTTPVMTFASGMLFASDNLLQVYLLAITTTRGENQTATYIEFNRLGTKLLANCQLDGIYMFDALLGSEREPRYLERMNTFVTSITSN